MILNSIIDFTKSIELLDVLIKTNVNTYVYNSSKISKISGLPPIKYPKLKKFDESVKPKSIRHTKDIFSAVNSHEYFVDESGNHPPKAKFYYSHVHGLEEKCLLLADCLLHRAQAKLMLEIDNPSVVDDALDDSNRVRV